MLLTHLKEINRKNPKSTELIVLGIMAIFVILGNILLHFL